MSIDDLNKFIRKVENLNALIGSLEQFPRRKQELESCDTHDQVVELAKSWGFEIGKRWGE